MSVAVHPIANGGWTSTKDTEGVQKLSTDTVVAPR